MKKLGHIRNQSHDGLFVIFCDAKARFGGWDEHGDMLSDEGSSELELDGQRAFVEEAHGSGQHEVFACADGTIFFQPPLEDGVVRIPEGDLETAVRTEVIPMAYIDVPSGTLTIALAYPPLNTTTKGDHEGVTHAEGERLDLPTSARTFAITREFVGSGQVVALRPQKA